MGLHTDDPAVQIEHGNSRYGVFPTLIDIPRMVNSPRIDIEQPAVVLSLIASGLMACAIPVDTSGTIFQEDLDPP